MAAKLGQVSIPAPGAQGLNSEVSPFSGETQWALRADNAVVDRVGRLASREAFTDLTTSTEGFPSEYDIVRLTRLETEASIQYADRTEYGTALFGLSEYSGNGFRKKIVQDLTFGLAGSIGQPCDAMGDLWRAGEANNMGIVMGDGNNYYSTYSQRQGDQNRWHASMDFGDTLPGATAEFEYGAENLPGGTRNWTSNFTRVPTELSPCDRNAAGRQTWALSSTGRNQRLRFFASPWYGPESGTSDGQTGSTTAPVNPTPFTGTINTNLQMSVFIWYDPEDEGITESTNIEWVDWGNPNWWTVAGGDVNPYISSRRYLYYPKTGILEWSLDGGPADGQAQLEPNLRGWFTFGIKHEYSMFGVTGGYSWSCVLTQDITLPDGTGDQFIREQASASAASTQGYTNIHLNKDGPNAADVNLCFNSVLAGRIFAMAHGNNLTEKQKNAFVQHMEGYVPDPDRPVEYSNFFGFVQDGKTLKSVPLSTKNGVTKATLVPFKDSIYVFSKGEEVQRYDGTEVTKLSDDPFYFPPQDDGQTFFDICDGDVACSAYGRLWVSGCDGDYQTIYYSDMLRPEQWYDGRGVITDESNSAGIISVAEYWPSGGDKIQGIAAHNGFLVVFGRESILIYSGAEGDPAGDPNTGFGGLKLEDAIRDVGLVNQDAMCNIGSDHLFVDSLGVRSLGRVIQEKSTPLAEASMNVASMIRPMIEQYRDTVRMFHMPSKSLVVCLFPNSDQEEALVFQLGQPSASGGLKMTRWTGCDFYDGITVRTDVKDEAILGAKKQRGLTEYRGYSSPTNYDFKYESTVIAPTQNLMQTIIPKSVSYSYITDLTPTSFDAIWGFGSEMTYSRPLRNPKGKTEFKTLTTSLNGAGEMLRLGFETTIEGDEIAVQQISLNMLLGRIIV